MLPRVFPLPFLVCLTGASLALSTVACSSLTHPDEIQIYAEPAPPPKAAPARPAAGNPGAPGNQGAQQQAAPSGG